MTKLNFYIFSGIDCLIPTFNLLAAGFEYWHKSHVYVAFVGDVSRNECKLSSYPLRFRRGKHNRHPFASSTLRDFICELYRT